VAEQVDKVAEDIADDLPAGGKLKEAVTFIENLAERTAKDAQLVDDTIEKVLPKTLIILYLIILYFIKLYFMNNAKRDSYLFLVSNVILRIQRMILSVISRVIQEKQRTIFL
jgi:hypothetical protein